MRTSENLKTNVLWKIIVDNRSAVKCDRCFPVPRTGVVLRLLCLWFPSVSLLCRLLSLSFFRMPPPTFVCGHQGFTTHPLLVLLSPFPAISFICIHFLYPDSGYVSHFSLKLLNSHQTSVSECPAASCRATCLKLRLYWDLSVCAFSHAVYLSEGHHGPHWTPAEKSGLLCAHPSPLWAP